MLASNSANGAMLASTTAGTTNGTNLTLANAESNAINIGDWV